MREYLKAWFNYHWFLYHFFSVPILIGSFFAPWRRMQEGKKRGFDPGEIAGRIIINTVLRITGMCIRAVFLVVAVVSQGVLLVLGAALMLYLITSPISIPATFLTGLLLLFP